MENKSVKFDPGYAPLVMDTLGRVGITYYTFSAVSDKRMKKINYPHTLRKIENYLKANVSFYLGCMLWASYIKTFKNTSIEGNLLLGEKCEEKEYTQELTFLIDFVETTLQRDSKYYLNKPHDTDFRYLPILKAYKDFLILNKGFCNCSNTDEIILPNYLRPIHKPEELNEKIQEAIKNKNIESLLDLYDILF